MSLIKTPRIIPLLCVCRPANTICGGLNSPQNPLWIPHRENIPHVGIKGTFGENFPRGNFSNFRGKFPHFGAAFLAGGLSKSVGEFLEPQDWQSLSPGVLRIAQFFGQFSGFGKFSAFQGASMQEPFGKVHPRFLIIWLLRLIGLTNFKRKIFHFLTSFNIKYLKFVNLVFLKYRLLYIFITICSTNIIYFIPLKILKVIISYPYSFNYLL